MKTATTAAIIAVSALFLLTETALSQPRTLIPGMIQPRTLIPGMAQPLTPNPGTAPKIVPGKPRAVTAATADKPAENYGTRITSSGGSKWLIEWSPRGDVIAYGSNSDIYIVPAAGGEPLNLTGQYSSSYGNPTFTPDGKFLTFVNYTDMSIDYIDLDTGDYAVLLNDAMQPAWSPDYRYLAYVSTAGTEINVLDFDSGDWNTVQISGTTYGVSFLFPVLAMDQDNNIIFTGFTGTGDTDNTEDLYSKNVANGSQYRRLTNNEQSCWYPDVSPDGRWILYSDWAMEDLWALDTTDMSTHMLFPEQTKYNWCGSFSPDGTQICYLYSEDGESYDVYVAPFPLASPASITLNSPNGGEIWDANTQQTISWTASGIETVRLEYLSETGATWQLIANSIPAENGSFTWTTPDIDSGQVQVRAIGKTNDGSTIVDRSDVSFTIRQSVVKSITVLSPAEGDVLIAGSTHNVKWEAVGVSGSFNVFLSTDGGGTMNRVPAGVTGTSFDWSVPDVESTNCYIEIRSVDDSTVRGMSGKFTIKKEAIRKEITVTFPNGGETLAIGDTATIKWNSTGITTVKIEYSLDNGATWTLLNDMVAASDTKFDWLIDISPPAAAISYKECFVRISESGNISVQAAPASDMSDQTFIITRRIININASVALDTVLDQAGLQGYNDISGIGPDELVACAVYGVDWSTARSFKITMTWNDALGQYAKAKSYYHTNGEQVHLNGADITLPAEANILERNNGTVSMTGEVANPGFYEVTLVRNETSASWQNEGLLFLPVFRTAQTFGGGYNFSVDFDIEVTDSAGTRKNLTRRTFTVEGADIGPQITVVTPNGSEEFLATSNRAISWDLTEPGDVKVEISTDNGATWSTLIASTPCVAGNNTRVVTVPDTPSNQCLVRVTLLSDSSVTDTSDSPFTILSAASDYLSIVSPTVGDTWSVGSEKEIRWAFSGIQAIRLEVSYNDGGSWDTIADDFPASSGSYPWTVTDKESENCRIRITSMTNDSLTSTSGRFSIVKLSFEITLTDQYTELNQNDPVSFEVAVTGGAEIDSVRIHYNLMNDRSILITKHFKDNEDNTYSYLMPTGTFISPGIEYYITAADVNGTEVRLPPDVGYYAITARLSDSTSPVTVQGGSEENAYSMISVPLNLTASSVEEQLSGLLPTGEMKTDWRLFRYPAGSTSANEYPNIEPFEPARAFWLITKSNYALKTSEGVTVSTAEPFLLTLKSGWNDIANPWMFNINWQDKENPGNATLSPLYTYEKGWKILTDPGKLEPWKGYAVKNMDSSDRIIYLHSLSQSTAKPAEPQGGELWRVTIEASAGAARDDITFFGVGTDAAETWDSRDYPEPPPVGNYVSVAFPHDDWPRFAGTFTSDFRPPAFTNTWDFVVTSNIERALLTVTLNGLDRLPPGTECLIIDRDTEKSVTLSGGTFSFMTGSGETARRFRAIVTNEDFREDTGDGPTAFITAVCYPNPFNPRTTIRYEIARSAKVKISVFNSLGQKVTSYDKGWCAPGAHEWVFEGRDLTSGLYVYRIEAGPAEVTGKMLYMK